MPLTIRLLGECNRCGLCCAPVLEGKRYYCMHLYAPRLGEPSTATCQVYGNRYDGMPIILVADDLTQRPGHCRKDSPEETAAIMAHGVGKGCSLRPEVGVE